jgi:zinc D-Ala-D-Ala carboxypeptidase
MGHFKLSEFACPCCGKNGINPDIIPLLEKIREDFGKPIVINSGFRCKAHNTAVGGTSKSAHLTGEAVDIQAVNGADRFRLIQIALAKGITRIGIANGFIHMDISKTLPQNTIWLYS